MYEIEINLPNVDKVYAFNKAITQIPCDMDMFPSLNHRHVVDAKSIMGIFTLDLSNKLTLRAYTDDPGITARIRNVVTEIERDT